MDYPYANFGEFSFSRFGFILRTESQRRMIATGYSLDDTVSNDDMMRC